MRISAKWRALILIVLSALLGYKGSGVVDVARNDMADAIASG